MTGNPLKEIQGARGGSGNLPVSRVRTAYQQVADQLRELILTGSLSAGDRLPSEAELAATFGVSRSTVREALRVLASRDLIRTTRGTTGGTFVSTVNFEQVSDYLETSIGLMSGSASVTVGEMLEAREVLEVPAARLAALRRGDDHLKALREAIEREMLTRGRGGRFREHRNFHAIIVEAAGNRLLSMMTEPVFRVLQAKFLSPNVPDEFWAGVDHEHEAILAAIENGDGEAAAAEMLKHLIALREAYSD
ncbi:FadR/GntR family transcriptional regulator [Micromonospora sp. CP22]|uniref:FadR/GntR family transcriptional regulator n=1 Tax=Micromonospora sp. CP22 TaxID=2580517 RepID=UPI0012BB6481|nr:FadR/GntR family transcriptional regulator [Micromonospora sp. CP22]MTK05060.1 FadR family transcriptional regulator [Micromonospora sp. CP22]